MILILKNDKTVGIDQQLINKLNLDLSTLSNFINTLDLKISALTNSVFYIDGIKCKVEQIPLLSTENIQVFDLNIIESKPETDENNVLNVNIPDYENKIPEIEPLHTEPELKINTDEINLINKAEINQEETQKETLPELKEPQIFQTNENIEEKQSDKNLNEPILTIEKETNEASNQKNEEQLLDISIMKKDNQEEEKPKEQTISSNIDQLILEEENQSETYDVKHEEEYIEISFEDDLQEINNILMDKANFNNSIKEELKKASNELSIDYKDLVDLYNQLLEQIKEEKNTIYHHLNDEDYENLHKDYHKLKGAALNLRLSKIALILKTLDELSKKHDLIDKIKKITDDFYFLIENDTEKLKTDKTTNLQIEDIVIKTIQTYLKTQNEKEFQKDKKYIEKLLGKKINNLKDLESILKGVL